MRGNVRFAVAFAVSVALAGPAFAIDTPPSITTNDTAIGTVLADSKGMTLYVFDEDSSGKSACYGRCAENWPPFKAADDARPFSGFEVIVRDDGISQWSYNGKPLYHWVRDKAAGDTTGDGVRGWQVARP